MKIKLFFLMAFLMSLGVMTAQEGGVPMTNLEQPKTSDSQEVYSNTTTATYNSVEAPNNKALEAETKAEANKLKALQKVQEADSKAAKAKRDATTEAVRQRLEKNKRKSKK